MDRLRDDRVGTQVNEGTIVDERRVQRSKRVLLEIRELANQAFERGVPRFERAGEAIHTRAASECRVRREIVGERAVEKYERVPATLVKVEALHIGRHDPKRVYGIILAT